MEKWKNKTLYFNEVKAMNLPERELIVFDLETTGLSPENDRIIELAAVKCRVMDDYSFEYIDELHMYINPGRPLPEKITELTGITDAQLADCPNESDVFDAVSAFFGNTAVGGYNSDRFDCKFMENYYGREGKLFTPCARVDAMKLAKARLRKPEDVENYKLISIADFFGIRFNAHSAIEDTKSTAKVLSTLLRECFLEELSDSICAPVFVEKIKPVVKSIKFWEGFRGFSRIYVNTSEGSVYYDIRGNNWGNKDCPNFEAVDMEYVEKEAWRMAGATSEEEFARYNGESRNLA